MKVTPLESPCREWQLGKNTHGYGTVRRQGKSWTVHRLVWTLANGPIPDGFCVCHRCDNPSCFRLDHLFLGTVADNNRDKARKGRATSWTNTPPATHCLRGHEFTPDNTYIYKNVQGRHRACKECNRIRALAWYHKNKGVAA